MPPRSSPSITSTTKRAKCLSGSHSSTDGGRRNAVRRSTSRKLLIAIKPPFGANQWRDSSENQRRWVKSDRLLAGDIPATRSLIAIRDRVQAACFPMPDLESFDRLNDKWQFYRLCLSLGIRTPNTRLFADVAALQASLEGSKPSRAQIVKPLN